MTGLAANWISRDDYAAQKEEALRRFGLMLRSWRKQNHWSQYTAADWAKEAGFHVMAAGNLSTIEHGKVANLRPSTIFHLAELNHRVAARDWGPVRTRALLDLLQQSRPITGDDGQLWGPTQFWACSVGLLLPPKVLQARSLEPAPVITDDDAIRLCEQWRQKVAQVVSEHDLDPIEALTGIGRHAPLKQRRRLRQVLSVSRINYSAAELLQGWEGGWLPERALEQWTMQFLHGSPAAESANADESAAGSEAPGADGPGEEEL